MPSTYPAGIEPSLACLAAACADAEAEAVAAREEE